MARTSLAQIALAAHHLAPGYVERNDPDGAEAAYRQAAAEHGAAATTPEFFQGLLRMQDDLSELRPRLIAVQVELGLL